ncbi:MAG: DUF5676 family membrane protein [Hyphomicrobium sp.]|uniref:DUF5676 family membrane protein n=1 Tax=Hyphomicrobium sp. TaxID=82 RepID=UPI00132BFD63|nr:DUF5676 family membrane protein [Hyphomicrobium sp.]KAB2943089.1 MAG: hypothetical protein F9K20_03420 [Hyphomicrobium sp.]MBZ0208966.1 DUF5676 family membrane protein [Hyphomicrobium sp.]
MAAGYETTSREAQIPIIAFGLSLSAFFAISYLICIALGLVVPDVRMHLPWLQFFPGFDWNASGMLLGLGESLVYGWYVAVVFGALFNFFAARRG